MNFPRYPEYKPSGVEWLGEIPTHWEVKRLRFVAKINPTKSEVNHLSEDTPVSFVPMDAVGEYGGLSLEAEKTLDEVKNGYTYFTDGDVVLAKITPCFENGKGALAGGLLNGIGFGTTELHVLRPTPAMDRQFLFYLSIAHPFRKIGEYEMYGAGGQKRVPEEFIKDIRPGLPPIEEQRAIAAFLDRETAKIDALIEKKRQFIELLQEKRAALISRAVTRGLDPNVPLKDSGVEWLGQIPAHWEVKKGRFMGTLLGSASPPEDDVIEDDDGTAYAKVDDLNLVDSSLLLVETKARVRDISAPRRKIILFPKRGAAIFTNKVVIADGVFLFDSNLMGWKIEPSHDTKFVAYCLLARRLDDLADVSTVPQINNKHIYPEKFPSPQLREQEVIVDFLEQETTKLDALHAKVESAIEKLKEYRAALIAAAVTGKIDVRAA